MSLPSVFRQMNFVILTKARPSGNRILFRNPRRTAARKRRKSLPKASVSRPKVSLQSVKPTPAPTIA